MPTTPCPALLGKLIKRENALAASDPHPLRLIARALQNRKQEKVTDTFAVPYASDVTMDFVRCKVSVRNDLADALAELDSPRLFDLIRECADPHCERVFWAGRAD